MPKSERCRGIRVLIVDDDPAMVAAMGTLLEMEGAEVATATNATDALQQLHLRAPAIVLADLGMNGQDGYALIEKIHSMPEFDRLPVIALTGSARQEDILRCRQAGFHGHICKPVVFEDLVQHLVDAVGTRPKASLKRSSQD